MFCHRSLQLVTWSNSIPFLHCRYSRKWLMIAGMVAWSTSILVATFMPVRMLDIGYIKVL